MIRLGVLGSTKGTDLGAIIQAIDTEELKAKISVVVSNQKNAYILERARVNKIPHHYISHKNEKRLNTKCQELGSEIASQQARVDAAKGKTREDEVRIYVRY